MSASYCGKVRYLSCLLFGILSQRPIKSIAVCDVRRITRIRQACHVVWLRASVFLPRVQRAEGNPEKRISDQHVVLVCELLMLLQWSRVWSGIGLNQFSFIQMPLETHSAGRNNSVTSEVEMVKQQGLKLGFANSWKGVGKDGWNIHSETSRFPLCVQSFMCNGGRDNCRSLSPFILRTCIVRELWGEWSI